MSYICKGKRLSASTSPSKLTKKFQRNKLLQNRSRGTAIPHPYRVLVWCCFGFLLLWFAKIGFLRTSVKQNQNKAAARNAIGVGNLQNKHASATASALLEYSFTQFGAKIANGQIP